MHLFAVTGGIASGKTTVSTALAGLGCPIIDADVIARQVVEPGKPAWKLIIGHFGVDVLLDDGRIDRPKLGRVIFEDAGKRHLLNSCTHPYIQKAMLWEAVKCFLRGEPFVVVVSPLLFESGRLLGVMKKIVVVKWLQIGEAWKQGFPNLKVWSTHEQQVERLIARDKITENEALQRIQAQMPLAEKCRKADIVIDNSEDHDFTLQQVQKLYEEMMKLSSHQWIYRVALIIALVVGIAVLIKIVF